jgi:hypothetical protein
MRKRLARLQGSVWLVPHVLVVTGILCSPGQGLGQASPANDVTFARDVAPILQASCQVCHRPGNVAPMSLLTYEQARPFAALMADRVSKRIMPPWPLDVTVGIQEFKNNRALSEEDIRTIVRWADAGAPLGDVADLPPAIDWPGWSDYWSYEDRFGRPPDLVISSPVYHVPAEGLDRWPNLKTVVEGLEEPRWIRALELRPGSPETRYVYHHANPRLTLPTDAPDDMMGGGQLVQSAAGADGYIFPENTGRLLVPGSTINWPIHYFPGGEAVDAFLDIGVWFYPKDEVPRFVTAGEQHLDSSQGTAGGASEIRMQGRRPMDPQMGGSQPDIMIPPNSLSMLRGTVVLDRAIRVHSLRGHMHLRGKHQIVEAVYPDGHWEIINKLDWNHAWATAFLYEDHAMPLLPKGTVLIVTSVWDNTADNESNPDPNQWVVRGDRSVDEMGHIRFGVTYLSEEEFEELVAERERILAEREAEQRVVAAVP